MYIGLECITSPSAKDLTKPSWKTCCSCSCCSGHTNSKTCGWHTVVGDVPYAAVDDEVLM